MNMSRPFSHHRRRGAAFLMLVLLVLLVVVGASRTLVTGEVSARGGEAARLRATSLHSAIDAVVESNLRTDDLIRLPVDPSQNQQIEVSIKANVVTARWLVGESVIDEMVRPVASAGSEAANEPERESEDES